MKALLFFLLGPAALVAAGASSVDLKVQPVTRPVQLPFPQLRIKSIEASRVVQAELARRDFNVDGRGLCIAVLDTGIRRTHHDFTGRVMAGKNFTTAGQPEDVTDRSGHGTHVAGIAAAGGDHVGIAPGATVMPLKVLDDSGEGKFADIEKALAWVVENHAAYNISVVNLSLGAGVYRTDDAEFDQTNFRRLVGELRRLRIAVTAAAGNDYGRFQVEGLDFPACLRDTISVGAVFDANIGAVSWAAANASANTSGPDVICPFSQRLAADTSPACQLDVFAPGAPMTSSGIDNDNGESIDSGTSEAAPVAAGVILLIQQFVRDATGSLPEVDDVETWIRDSAVKIVDGDDEDDNVPHSHKSYRRINASEALLRAQRTLTLQMLRQNVAALQLDADPAQRLDLSRRSIDTHTARR